MVMVGGPLMNFLLAVIVFFIAGLIQGFPNYDATKISSPAWTKKPTPAYVAGLRSGDVIIELRCAICSLSRRTGRKSPPSWTNTPKWKHGRSK